MRRRTPQYFYAFDLLWVDGRDLRHVPLVERKRLLRTLIPLSPCPILYAEHVPGTGIDLFRAVCGWAVHTGGDFVGESEEPGLQPECGPERVVRAVNKTYGRRYRRRDPRRPQPWGEERIVWRGEHGHMPSSGSLLLRQTPLLLLQVFRPSRNVHKRGPLTEDVQQDSTCGGYRG